MLSICRMRKTRKRTSRTSRRSRRRKGGNGGPTSSEIPLTSEEILTLEEFFLKKIKNSNINENEIEPIMTKITSEKLNEIINVLENKTFIQINLDKLLVHFMNKNNRTKKIDEIIIMIEAELQKIENYAQHKAELRNQHYASLRELKLMNPIASQNHSIKPLSDEKLELFNKYSGCIMNKHKTLNELLLHLKKYYEVYKKIYEGNVKISVYEKLLTDSLDMLAAMKIPTVSDINDKAFYFTKKLKISSSITILEELEDKMDTLTNKLPELCRRFDNTDIKVSIINELYYKQNTTEEIKKRFKSLREKMTSTKIKEYLDILKKKGRRTLSIAEIHAIYKPMYIADADLDEYLDKDQEIDKYNNKKIKNKNIDTNTEKDTNTEITKRIRLDVKMIKKQIRQDIVNELNNVIYYEFASIKPCVK